VEDKDWVILQTIYEERNITKAAERLYISQPALTYRLQQLEKELGTKLVSRGKKGVEFTSQGEYLVKYAKDMLLQLRKTKEYIQNMDNKVRGTLRLGVSSNFGRYKLPTILKDFLDHYPDVEIEVTTGWSSEVVQLVYKENIHVGIIRGDYSWQEQKHLLSEEVVCIVSKKEISIEELPYLPRINYKTDHLLKNLIESWWQERFTRPPLISMEVDRIDTCKEMVMNGLGYAIFPSVCLKESDDLYTINLSLKDGQIILRKTWMVCRNSSLELSVIKAFFDFLKNGS
jgi:DNA-binding transcriptional LysR family regulator